MRNCVEAIYEPFTAEEISAEISDMVRPDDIPWKGEIKVIYQGIENLHASIPVHNGDWYFTGKYPTSGGYKVVNQAFVSFYEGDDNRPYDMLF
jgi:amidophosphoribosyltransferase